MEPSGSRAIRKPASRLTRLLALALVLIGGTWLARETDWPSKAEARQMRAELVAVYELRVADRFREADLARSDYLHKWERYTEWLSEKEWRVWLTISGLDEEPQSAQRQAAVVFLKGLPADWPPTRRLVLPTSLAVVGLALFLVSFRSSRFG